MTATATSSTPPAPHWTTLDWSVHVHDATIGGRRLRYVDYGDGPPLVLLHGLGCCWQWWLENLPTLGREHRVVAVDLPGFGHSEPLPAPGAMASHAEAVLELADQLGLGPLIVGGHSMGGLVTLAMGATAPERVRAMVLVNAGGVPMTNVRLAVVQGVLRQAQRVLVNPMVVRALIARPRARKLLLQGAMADPASLRRELASEVVPLMSAPGFMDAIAAAGLAMKASRPEDVRCPVLLVWGDKDPIVTVANAHAMLERLPDGRLELLPGIGHSPMIESPEAFNEKLLAFTRGLQQR